MAFKCTVFGVLALAALASASILPREEGNTAAVEETAFEPTAEEMFLTDSVGSDGEGDFSLDEDAEVRTRSASVDL